MQLPDGESRIASFAKVLSLSLSSLVERKVMITEDTKIKGKMIRTYKNVSCFYSHISPVETEHARDDANG